MARVLDLGGTLGVPGPLGDSLKSATAALGATRSQELDSVRQDAAALAADWAAVSGDLAIATGHLAEAAPPIPSGRRRSRHRRSARRP